MFTEESIWIVDLLESLNFFSGCKVLDIGSSTTEFRNITQPHIENNVFKPLRNRGCEIFHVDKKNGDGIDIVYNISDPEMDTPSTLAGAFDLVLCCNLLEHVSDVRETARRVTCFVKRKGYILVTVPKYYRRHPDPIDTMFRPSPKELKKIFQSVDPELVLLKGQIVTVKNKQCYSAHKSSFPLWGYRDVFRFYVPWARWKVSCVLFQKR